MDPQDLPREPADDADHADPADHEPTVIPGAFPSLVLPGADGAHALGPATIDSDADGVVDTAMVPPPRPACEEDLFSLATDLDHDGDVDVLTTVSVDGTARTDAVDPGWARGPGWEPGWDGPAPPGATLDPATGAWTRGA